MASDLTSLDEILSQPATSTVQPGGKFRPKPKSKSKNDVTNLVEGGLFAHCELSSGYTLQPLKETLYPESQDGTDIRDTEGLGTKPFDVESLGGGVHPTPASGRCYTATRSSFEVLTGNPCNSAPVDSSAHHLVIQEAADLMFASRSEVVHTSVNENMDVVHESSGREAPSNSGVESFDAILLQPASTTAVGKFRPKPIVMPKTVHPSTQHLVTDMVVGTTNTPRLGAAVSNTVLQMDHASSRIAAVDSFSGLDLDDIVSQQSKSTSVPQLPTSHIEGLGDGSPHINASTSIIVNLLTISASNTAPIAQEAADLINVECSKVVATDANEKERIDHENLGVEAPTVSSGLDSFDDSLFQQNGTATIQGVHNFQSETKTSISISKTTTPVIPPDAMGPVPSPPLEAISADMPPPVDVALAPFQQDSHFLASGTDSLEKSKAPNLEVEVPGVLQSIQKTLRKESTVGKKRKASKNKTVVRSSAVSVENEAGNAPMQLRKRTAVLSPVDEVEDETEETSDTSVIDGDNDYNEESTAKQKVPRKNVSRTKTPATETETEKSGSRRKKASDKAEPTNKDPPKKFSHSIRRKRRTVSKELLETPEEDIDPRKLSMKDLIILADIKERRLNKEAEMQKKSFPSQSADNSFPSNFPYDDEDLLASNEGLDLDDDQLNHRAETSSSKLNYHSFMNRTPSERWSKSETEMFYEAIRQFGTDFTMIQQLFPGRTRHQVKLKYKAEERKQPLQLADALVHRSKDHSHFELVIERLQHAQAEQNTDDVEITDRASENEEETMVSDPKAEELVKEELVHSPVKSNSSQDVFDWSNYGTAYTSSP